MNLECSMSDIDFYPQRYRPICNLYPISIDKKKVTMLCKITSFYFLYGTNT
ncbi:hypothetical protein SAMN04488028_105172 [Reichenbachiella agariperforans]|uniref:Uncharacterized protein n=1 Tax=Reichenbachiella agariperforans TaxID=156994 RepID=A0A1M6SVJ7_REIAG|nr:hypothetical protein SAMN04488028_105172 [Reichenbachiella agariperforans]